MAVVPVVLLALGTVSCLAWLWLVFNRGFFWRTEPRLESGIDANQVEHWPDVSIVVPARNEADVLPDTLPALLSQDYSGEFYVFLVDDNSDDGTADVAEQIAAERDQADRVTVVRGQPLPSGWTGKLWALRQGDQASASTGSRYILHTDADILHGPEVLRSLVARAEVEERALVSVMARLRTDSFWERLLIPAFVYFFAKLYPFRWVSDARKSTAGAAGGCILVRRESLDRIGGLESMRNELIDDCALAQRVKSTATDGRGIWLGLSESVESLRGYGTLSEIWDVVARTAYVQLQFSPLLVAGTVLGMLLLYLSTPIAVVGGLVYTVASDDLLAWPAFGLGVAAWGLMSVSYVPMLGWHGVSRLYSPLLPLIAGLYTLMTVDSARRWAQGRGGGWKGRTYEESEHRVS